MKPQNTVHFAVRWEGACFIRRRRQRFVRRRGSSKGFQIYTPNIDHLQNKPECYKHPPAFGSGLITIAETFPLPSGSISAHMISGIHGVPNNLKTNVAAIATSANYNLGRGCTVGVSLCNGGVHPNYDVNIITELFLVCVDFMMPRRREINTSYQKLPFGSGDDK